MTDTEFADRAAYILHRMALEHCGTVSPSERWVVQEEQLRNEAANLMREARWVYPRRIGTHYVGDDE